MITFLERCWGKVQRVCFHMRNRGRFGYLGAHAYLASPYRLDHPRGVHIGALSVCARGVWLYCHDELASIVIGEGCQFGFNNHIAALGHLQIGKHVLTASNVYISDNVHCYEDPNIPVMHQPVMLKSEVSIGDGTWLGENACIIGASVGRNCVIGANAVVTHDIPDYCVAVGSPARVIKQFDPLVGKWSAVMIDKENNKV